ncbi:B12-binding domain-containing radical SAM protein [Geopsychrobacter electrodiphilus]|uniref:B12-binding domain-containing radical SAM protein n=1 Tax=Geopsychrobacter electrodiphilus TaxID=225196 RepID=UPI00036E81E1|nr:B12-binding domain-containing radical SAM protein [Geopsychrobacter electrodiphilus]
MKILIVSLHVRRSAQAVALAAGNLKAALPEKVQQQTQLLDLYLQQPLPQMLKEIRNARADLIAFSFYLWNRQQLLDLAAALKTAQKPPFLLAGGPEASADSTRLLATGLFDALLRGEGEESFALLVERLSQKSNLTGIAGLSLSARQPLPAACSCDVTRLKSPWLSQTLRPAEGGVLWEVARGCPFRCDFCYDAKGMAGVRPLPLARLAAELESFSLNSAEQVWVLDSTFNAPPRRGHTLLQLLLEKGPQLHYHLEAKAEFIDDQTIDLLSQLSCSVQLGLQSADDGVLAGLNRKIDPLKFWAGVEKLADSGLTFGLDLIYGLPGDSYAGFCASLNRALSYRPNQVDIFPLAVLPGTRLFEQQQELGLKADAQPPYLLRQSPDFSPAAMHDCSLLAAAADIFYNFGRAVGFMLPLCESLRVSPLRLLEDFRDWVKENKGGEEALLSREKFKPQEILQLQQDFLQQRLYAAGQPNYVPLVADILEYHYRYAETLLGPETLPAAGKITAGQRLHLAAGVCLIELRCDILGALETEAIDLKRWGKLVEQTPTRGLMIRRGNQVFTEVLTEEFAELLGRAQTARTRQQLLAGLPTAAAEELLPFALQEGLLVAAPT